MTMTRDELYTALIASEHRRIADTWAGFVFGCIDGGIFMAVVLVLVP